MKRSRKLLPDWIVKFTIEADNLLKSSNIFSDGDSLFVKSSNDVVYTYKKIIVLLIGKYSEENYNMALSRLLCVYHATPKKIAEYDKLDNYESKDYLVNELKELLQKTITQSFYAISIISNRNDFVNTTFLVNCLDSNIENVINKYMSLINKSRNGNYTLRGISKITQKEYVNMSKFLPSFNIKSNTLSYASNN